MTISHYRRITDDPDNPNLVHEACAFFDAQYTAAAEEIDVERMRGTRIEELHKRLPGVWGYRYAQLQELEAILGFLELRETAIKGLRRRHYIEHYNRTLNPTTAEKYVDADDNVLAVAMLRNDVALVRNRFHGLTKQLESLQFRLGDLSRMIVAGVNDAVL